MKYFLIGLAFGALPGLAYYIMGTIQWGPLWIVEPIEHDIRRLKAWWYSS